MLVGGLDGSAKNSGTIKFAMSEASGGVHVCAQTVSQLEHGEGVRNRRRLQRSALSLQ